jgi:hypothetical protein
MALNQTRIALEIAVLLGVLLVVEWLAHALTDTRNMFVAAVLTLGIYIALRVAFSAQRIRRAATARKLPRSR